MDGGVFSSSSVSTILYPIHLHFTPLPSTEDQPTYLVVYAVPSIRVHTASFPTCLEQRSSLWMGTMINESILRYFIRFLPIVHALWKNPSPIVVDALFDHHLSALRVEDSTQIAQLCQNSNERIVDWLLGEHPDWIRIGEFVFNDHPRAVEWCAHYLLDTDALPDGDCKWRYLNSVMARTKCISTMDRIWAILERVGPYEQCILAFAHHDHPHLNQLRLRDFDRFDLCRTNGCQKSQDDAIMTAYVNRLRMKEKENDDEKREWDFIYAYTNPHPILVNYLLEEVFPRLVDSAGDRERRCASNPHPRMVEYVLSTLQNEKEPRPGYRRWVMACVMRNPAENAVAFSKEVLSWPVLEELFGRETDRYSPISMLSPERVMHLLLNMMCANDEQQPIYTGARAWAIVEALSVSNEIDVQFEEVVGG